MMCRTIQHRQLEVPTRRKQKRYIHRSVTFSLQHYGLMILLLFMPRSSKSFMVPTSYAVKASMQSRAALSVSSLATISWSKRCQRFRVQPSLLSASGSPIQSTHHLGAISMFFLCLQFAFQPVLTRSFASKSIQRGSYVLMQDVLRITMSLALLNTSLLPALQGWTLLSALQAAGVPSMLYLVQNICSLMAYQHLSPITYNVLNQTKTLSAAIFCYLLLGQRQTPQQMVALFLLVLAALVMEGSLGKLFSATIRKSSKEKDSASDTEDSFSRGIVPVLVASTTSGLAGALAQKSLQQHARNAMIFNMELAACSIVIMLLSKIINGVRQTLVEDVPHNNDSNGSTESPPKPTFWTGWTKQTWIPLMTNAAGGVLVGLVTKYAGAVQKGFSLILGMFLSGLLQNYLPAGKGENQLSRSKRVTGTQWLGGLLAAVSLILHVSYPPTV